MITRRLFEMSKKKVELTAKQAHKERLSAAVAQEKEVKKLTSEWVKRAEEDAEAALKGLLFFDKPFPPSLEPEQECFCLGLLPVHGNKEVLK
jgi:hypothetical protein